MADGRWQISGTGQGGGGLILDYVEAACFAAFGWWIEGARALGADGTSEGILLVGIGGRDRLQRRRVAAVVTAVRGGILFFFGGIDDKSAHPGVLD